MGAVDIIEICAELAACSVPSPVATKKVGGLKEGEDMKVKYDISTSIVYWIIDTRIQGVAIHCAVDPASNYSYHESSFTRITVAS